MVILIIGFNSKVSEGSYLHLIQSSWSEDIWDDSMFRMKLFWGILTYVSLRPRYPVGMDIQVVRSIAHSYEPMESKL